MKDALHGHIKNDATIELRNKANGLVNPTKPINTTKANTSKRKQICNALARTAKKRDEKCYF